MRNEILRMEQIVTYSRGTKVLKNAKLNLFEGEVIGIVGVNYSGKTALVGAITGLLPYHSGRTLIMEKPERIVSISQAANIGIYYIQSKSTLIDSFTIAENIFLTSVKNLDIRINKAEENRRTRELLDMFGSDVPEDTLVGSLSYKDRIIVDICKAIAREAKILIFDSIISAITPSDIDLLRVWFDLLCTFHVGIILIEAGIKPLKSFCNRLFVIRDGKTVGVLNKEKMDDTNIISLMLGYQLNDVKEFSYEIQNQKKIEIFSMNNVCCDDTLKNLTISIYLHEILGILCINSQTCNTFERLFSGLSIIDSGEIKMEGEYIHLSNNEDAWAHGIAVIPEEDQLHLDFTLEDNITLAALKRNSRFFVLNKAELKYLQNELVDEYISSQDWDIHKVHDVPDGCLFQKKIAFCRALASSPKLMVLTNPTQKIDYISKLKIYEDIISLKRKKVTALILSTNINELVSVCERIIIVKEGQVKEIIFVNDNIKKEILMKYGKYLKDI